MHRNCEYPELHVPARLGGVERCPPCKRPRRRGPRSLAALQRRALSRFTPPAGILVKSGSHLPGAPAGVLFSVYRYSPLEVRASRVDGQAIPTILNLDASVSNSDIFVPPNGRDCSFNTAFASGPTEPSGWGTSRAAPGSRRLAVSTGVRSPSGAGDNAPPNDNRNLQESQTELPQNPAGARADTLENAEIPGVRARNRDDSKPEPQLKPAPLTLSAQSIRIWSINARKLLRRRAELEARLLNAGVDIICVQETWLSDDVESVTLSGYTLIGRLDRAMGPKKGYGGIAIFVRNSLSSIAVLEYSETSERMWCVLHTHIGALLLGNWYRPPDDDGRSMNALDDEIQRLRTEVVGIILVGDANVHHKRWLRHSNDNTQLGERLWHISQDNGLKQLVKKPTRGQYLLDLVLTDVPELVTVTVLPELSDHRIVCIDLAVHVPTYAEIPREVWDFKYADWIGLKQAMASTKWRLFLEDDKPDESAAAFCSHLISLCDQYIPKKTITERTSNHPWLDEDCIRAIEEKCNASGRSEYRQKELECSKVLTQAFLKYQRELREKIASLPSSSKEWWKYNKELLNRKTKNSGIAPLKGPDGQWVLDPKSKADLLATTFESKCQLPPPPPPERRPQREHPPPKMPEFTLIRSRWVLRILKALKEGKASGPDGIPVRIFRECCKELAPAIAHLVRFLLRNHCWPNVWRQHRVQPLFKKGAVSKPGNYRGVHLTDILSKLVERSIA